MRKIIDIVAAVALVFCLAFVGYRVFNADWDGEPSRSHLEDLARSVLTPLPGEISEETFVDKYTFKVFRARANTDATFSEVIATFSEQAGMRGWNAGEATHSERTWEFVHCVGKVWVRIHVVDKGLNRALATEAAWSSDPFDEMYCEEVAN